MTASVVTIQEPGQHKVFTYVEACDLVPVLLKITRNTINQLKPHLQKMSYLTKYDPLYQRTQRAYQEIIHRWVNKMVRLGVEVKGMWIVDLDSGYGYFCWKYPEESLSYFHRYTETFKQRQRIHLVSRELV